VSSSGGVIDVQYQLTSPGGEYGCIGSVFVDDSFGGVIGDCATNSSYNKIWVKVS